MPLTSLQKEIIDATLSDFLDFPEDAESLQNAIIQLQKIFFETRSSTTLKGTENADYERLHNCFIQPTEYLLNLEKQHGNITIKEVQQYIFDLITAKIKKAANAAQVNFTSLNWGAIPAAALVEKRFVSRTLPVREEDNPNPYFIKPPHKIFTFNFNHHTQPHPEKPRTTIKGIQITITLHLEKDKKPLEKLYFIDYVTLFQKIDKQFKDKKQNHSIYYRIEHNELETQDSAEVLNAIVEQYISDFILQFLNIPSENISAGFKKLISHAYFYEALQAKKIPASEITQITSGEAEIFSNEAVINLHKAGYSLALLKRLSPSAVTLLTIPLYMAWFKSKKINVSQLNVTPEEVRNLTLPCVIHLLQREKLALTHALSLTPPTKVIIADEFYFTLIIQDKIKFTDIEKINNLEKNKLEERDRKRLLSERIINIKEAINLSNKVISLLNLHPGLANIVKKRYIHPYELEKILPHPHLACKEPLVEVSNSLKIYNFLQLAENALLFATDLRSYFKDAKDHSVEVSYNFCKMNAALRFKKIIRGTPLQLQDGSLDTIEKLRNHWEKFYYNFNGIYETVFQHFAHQFLYLNQKNDLYLLAEKMAASHFSLKIFWGRVLGIALCDMFSIFNTHHKIFSPEINLFKENIAAIAHQYHFSSHELRQLACDYFLQCNPPEPRISFFFAKPSNIINFLNCVTSSLDNPAELTAAEPPQKHARFNI